MNFGKMGDSEIYKYSVHDLQKFCGFAAKRHTMKIHDTRCNNIANWKCDVIKEVSHTK